MSTVIGIDASSKTIALVIGRGKGTVELQKVVLAKGSQRGGTPEACAEAHKRMVQIIEPLIQEAPKIEVFVEAPVLAGRRNIQTTIKQSLVNGAIQAAAVQAGASVVLVPVSTWKKAVVGRGNATKAEVARHLRSVRTALYRGCQHDQDLIDAACIYLYGRYHAE